MAENLRTIDGVKIGGVYRHYKGNLYVILNEAKHSESSEDLVVYQALYGDFKVWVRPRAMFLENVENDGESRPRFELVDTFGTDFQKKVWSEISKIPFGETKNYTEIAEAIEKPRAIRAVANACGKNPFPVLVPCHRVVGKNDIGGYAFGVEVKRKLLEKEKRYNKK